MKALLSLSNSSSFNRYQPYEILSSAPKCQRVEIAILFRRTVKEQASETEVHIHLFGILSSIAFFTIGFALKITLLWLPFLFISITWLGFITFRFRLDEGLQITSGRVTIIVTFLLLTFFQTIIFQSKFEWDFASSFIVGITTSILIYSFFFGLEPNQGKGLRMQ